MFELKVTGATPAEMAANLTALVDALKGQKPVDLTTSELGHAEQPAPKTKEKPAQKAAPEKTKFPKEPNIVLPTDIEPINLDNLKKKAADLALNAHKDEAMAAIHEYGKGLLSVKEEDYNDLYQKLEAIA